MNKNVILVLSLVVSSFMFSGCASLKHDVAKNEAKKKAKAMGLNLDILKEGEACKYVGFIGDNSVEKAKSNGKIKFKLFNYSYGDFFKKCTYVYGK